VKGMEPEERLPSERGLDVGGWCRWLAWEKGVDALANGMWSPAFGVNEEKAGADVEAEKTGSENGATPPAEKTGDGKTPAGTVGAEAATKGFDTAALVVTVANVGMTAGEVKETGVATTDGVGICLAFEAETETRVAGVVAIDVDGGAPHTGA
jgi:hypothetical protein